MLYIVRRVRGPTIRYSVGDMEFLLKRNNIDGFISLLVKYINIKSIFYSGETTCIKCSPELFSVSLTCATQEHIHFVRSVDEIIMLLDKKSQILSPLSVFVWHCFLSLQLATHLGDLCTRLWAKYHHF